MLNTLETVMNYEIKLEENNEKKMTVTIEYKSGFSTRYCNFLIDFENEKLKGDYVAYGGWHNMHKEAFDIPIALLVKDNYLTKEQGEEVLTFEVLED